MSKRPGICDFNIVDSTSHTLQCGLCIQVGSLTMTSQISSSPSVLLPSLSVISCRPLVGGPAIARQLNHSTKTQISDLENVSFWYICRIQQSSSLVGDAGHVHGNCHTPKGGASTDHIGLESLLEFTSKRLHGSGWYSLCKPRKGAMSWTWNEEAVR